MKIYLIRHGETAWNNERRVQGRTDIPLNETGERIAEVTAKGLYKEGISFERIFASPLSRAYRTAELIKEGTRSECKIEKKDLLIEFAFGALEGLKIPEIGSNPAFEKYKNCFMNPEKYVPEDGGESFQEIIARGQRILGEIVLPLEKEIPDGKAALCCHGAIIRAILVNLKQMPLADFWELSQLNCCVNCLEVKDGRIEILYENKLYYEPEKHKRLGPTTMLKRGLFHKDKKEN
jgi:broad specificity phosphatase PhoE